MTLRLRRLVGGVLCVISAGVAWGQSPEEIFLSGNAAYEQERYEEAAQAYSTVLKYRIEDPRVEFNLGNASFRLGRLGEAILHYERALRLDPTDTDIRDNLEYARSFCRDWVEPPPPMRLLRWVRTAQDALGPDRHAVAVLVLVWIVAGLVAWGLAKPGRWNATCGWSACGLALLVLLVASSGYVTYQRLQGGVVAVVLDPTAEVLAGPGQNNPTLFTVHEGLTVAVREEREEWVHVTLSNGLSGWVALDAVRRV